MLTTRPQCGTTRWVILLAQIGPGAHSGTVSWSLAEDTPRLQRFFRVRFGRALPVSAFGQSPLHDRMEFDHGNALDVAVDPSSSDGQLSWTTCDPPAFGSALHGGPSPAQPLAPTSTWASSLPGGVHGHDLAIALRSSVQRIAGSRVSQSHALAKSKQWRRWPDPAVLSMSSPPPFGDAPM